MASTTTLDPAPSAPTTSTASTTADPPAKPAGRARDPFFDNAKFVLVALVVVGHTIVQLPKTTTTDWLYDFLYAWHVPAFVLVTGYLSRSFDFSRPRVWALVRTVAVPYVVFELALAIFRMQVGGEELKHLWTNPHWPMWYLSALFFWRLMTPAFKRLPTGVAIVTAVGISLSAGFWAGSLFDFSRVFGLLPFFVIGLCLRPEHLTWLRQRWSPYAGLAVLASILVAARFTDRWISTEWLYYRTEYTDLGLTGGAATVTRLVVIAVGLLGAAAVLALIPATKTWFTALGSASLVVYLFHGFFIKEAHYLGVDHFADAHPNTALVLFPVAAVLLATLLSLPPVAKRLNRLVDPIGALQQVRLRKDPHQARQHAHHEAPMSGALR